MHERSLIRALLRKVKDVAAKYPDGRVVSIRVRIGEFSGVEADLLASAYEELVQDTPFRGADLELDKVPLEASCDHCGNQFRIERFNFQCERCGSLKLSLRGGEELLLDSVTMQEGNHEQKHSHTGAAGSSVLA